MKDLLLDVAYRGEHDSFERRDLGFEPFGIQ